ncbi:MAG: hypothetical protein Q8P81_00605 [Nanoarchaeota archaeon]|nr:hypothetical protein [Nanoarchaeota archaeon]
MSTPWNYPSPGIGNVGSYLISGDPFLSSSALNGTQTNNGEIKITFPKVTRSVTIVNTGSSLPIYVHFDSRANADVIGKGFYVEVTNQYDAWAFNCRCKEIYVSMKNAVAGGGFALSAELTNIPDTSMYTLTGAGINT